MIHPVISLDINEICNELLTIIEIEETKLLNWGFFDVRSDLDTHLHTLLQKLPSEKRQKWEKIHATGSTEQDLLKNLILRKLVFKITVAGQAFYRTRFAETIRLLYLLRQRFSFADYQTASRLVSDLKIHLQARRYPKRTIEPQELLAALQPLQMPPLYLEAIKSLLQESPSTSLKLAQFQKEAIIQQVRNGKSNSEHGIVIGAGTGSGKTKAFYVPALADIASILTDKYWTKVLAIYPRVELLKDQLKEAFSEARKLDTLLSRHNKRNIAIGAYYGDTPISAERFLKNPPASWQQNTTRDGWICPFFACPHCQSQELTWYRKDLEQERKQNQKKIYGRFSRLICPNLDCNKVIEGNQLLLTREHMIQQSPDILLTTTEMLNRRLSRTEEHHLFGIAPDSKVPHLVLLDEIHTYEGAHGAQIAYLLRRWKHARNLHNKNNICFVGLSATLTDAEEFFAKLTGIPIYQIDYIFPQEKDLIEEGLEYNVVLKGDPVSGTSLLSTSVQTVMLLGRMIDPTSTPSEQATYGKKIFAFTDKLDVLNRWYHIEYEAEFTRTLSQYRDFTDKTREIRRNAYLLGQDWSICQRVGHDLLTPLRLDITSSQYRGVNAQANFIIATSSLEVGFNDPDVGMVLQHKAPRSMASFLQRKGRAGRKRHIRPWMVVVTSAYGRDRWAFQHTEQLFHPQLDAINLPIDNYYVRKIQAAYILMDWLAYVLKYEKCSGDYDIWEALGSKDKGNSYLQTKRQHILQLLKAVLYGNQRESFKNYLTHALEIENKEIIHSLLWGEPRSLFFEVIPTLIRQLESNWQSIIAKKAEQWTDVISSNPLPDFVPPTLFSDLNVSELLLHIPESSTQSKASTQPTMREDEYLSLTQALNEFAPGRVNKRYSRKQHIREAHWLEVPKEEDISEGRLPLHLLKIECAEVTKRVTVDHEEYVVYQPRTYTLGLVPTNVKNSSHGHLLWRSHFTPKDLNGQQLFTSQAELIADQTIPQLQLAPSSPWRNIFQKIESYTQINGQWVEITRLATGAAIETYYTGNNGKEVRQNLAFEENGERAALGFTIFADALRFKFAPLDTENLLSNTQWPSLYQHLGPDYFLHKLQSDHRLASELTIFEIHWLWQLELSMLIATAVSRQSTLEDAASEVQVHRMKIAERAMKVIFQSQQKESDDDDEKFGRLHEKLIIHMENPMIQAILCEHERVLWEKNNPALTTWLQQCYASSLGATLFAAIIQLLPDINADSLIMDVEGNSIWISEETGGGIGIISRIASSIALRPGEFDLQMQDTVEHCDREYLAKQLHTIAHLTDQFDPELAQTFAAIRDGADIPKQLETRLALTRLLEKHGIAATRNLIVALNAKFLRPNSSLDTDKLIATLVRYWEKEEQRIGSEIDLRVMSVAALRIPEIKEQVISVLKRIGGQTTDIDESQVFNLLQSLLWLICHDSCPDCIQTSQPYQTLIRPSRSLLQVLIQPRVSIVEYGTAQWQDELQQALTTSYNMQVRCAQGLIEKCKQDLLHLLTKPIEIGYQLYYPMIERMVLTEQQWVITLHIRELMYA